MPTKFICRKEKVFYFVAQATEINTSLLYTHTCKKDNN